MMPGRAGTAARLPTPNTAHSCLQFCRACTAIPSTRHHVLPALPRPVPAITLIHRKTAAAGQVAGKSRLPRCLPVAPSRILASVRCGYPFVPGPLGRICSLLRKTAELVQPPVVEITEAELQALVDELYA